MGREVKITRQNILPSKSPTQKCLEQTIDYLENENKPLDNRQLLRLCQPVGDISAGTINPHFCHEIAEAAVNLLIQRKYARPFLNDSTNPAENVSQTIKPLVNKLPTQTWRSREQNIWQQFSPPPAIAYLLVYPLNLQSGDVVLEPSTGTGSLAVWASGAKLKTHSNEIDERRRDLLRCLGFDPTAHNAEFINDFLQPEIEPDCVLMNPPFSAIGERTRGKSSRFGFRHVASALKRLKPGGKFGLILGEAANSERKTAKHFLSELNSKFEFKTIVKIDGREYYKNGTTTDVNLIIGRKRLRTEQLGRTKSREDTISLAVQTVEDAFSQVLAKNLRLTEHS